MDTVKIGEYLPSVDMLKILSEEYGGAIKEILNGERLNDETEFKQAAEENKNNFCFALDLFENRK